MTGTARLPTDVQVWYTYCHLIDAGTVDEELGLRRGGARARHGARLGYFLSAPGHDFYPHFTHELEGLFRFGGCIPAIHARAEVCDTVLLGLQWLAEGGGLLVRAGEGIDEVSDLRGRRIGLSRSLNPRKVDYRRVTDERASRSSSGCTACAATTSDWSTATAPTTGTTSRRRGCP